MIKSFRKDTFGYCSLIFVISILIKLVQFKILPSKYFYDSNYILSLMNGNYIADKAYNFTAEFFDIINIFQFSTLQEWAILLSIIFTFIIFLILIRERKYNIIQYIFIYSSIVLLNIYVFNLSKDIIQFIFFLILYVIISNRKMSNFQKLLLSTIVLTYEALNFRIYYGIMLMLMWTIYIIYLKFIKNKKLTKKSVTKIIILAFLAFFFEVFIVQLISIDNYNSIINARSGVNIGRDASLDAVTIINDLLGQNTSYLIFIGNYIINTIRMLFPIELLFKGVKYIPFIVYQIFVTYNLFKCSKRLNNENILIIITIISFIMISIIFEPDFGSFIRHESTLILFLIKLSMINSDKNINIKLEESK